MRRSETHSVKWSREKGTETLVFEEDAVKGNQYLVTVSVTAQGED
jgi:hypothetical protein